MRIVSTRAVRPRHRGTWLWNRIFGGRSAPGEGSPDYVYLGIASIILFIGLITLSSATSILSFQETSGGYYFLRRQLVHGVIPGLCALYLGYRIPYTWYQRYTAFFLLGVYVLLGAVFIPQLRSDVSQTRSWIDLGVISFQTSEPAKLFFILWFAGWASSRQSRMKSLTATSIPFFLILGSIAFLLMLQPDVGTMLLLCILAFSLFLVAEGNFLHTVIAWLFGALATVPIIAMAPYRMQRILIFLHPETDTQGFGYQVYQGLIALGSGSWLGLGIGKSQQKLYFVPEIESDSIFAIIGEELGFIFAAMLIILICSLFLRGIRIALRANNRYASLIAVGISLNILYQAGINIGAIVGLLPLTGLPLPFISLGGTNVVVLMASLGIVLNISRSMR